jgi:hypothetical protein
MIPTTGADPGFQNCAEPYKSKLIWLMSSEDNFIIKNTSSLLCSLFKERDLVLKGY